MTNYKRLKFACYTSNISMSVVASLSPLLFLTFRSLYGISYSLLGLLVLINFSTQLTIDLIFSFFSHKFNIPKIVKVMPLITVLGLFVYAVWPFFMPNNVYLGLAIGTVIFSLSAGLGEVLISPVIASIPSNDPDREMSKLHSIYAWGVVFVVIFSTLFLFVAGEHNWQWLALIFILIPLTSFILYKEKDIPTMEAVEKSATTRNFLKDKGVWLCVAGIFLGGAAECTMAQWCSGYLEQALNIPKVWGDIFGVALFSVMLGAGRSLYAKIGKNIGKVLFFGAIGATACYLIAAIFPIPSISLFACAFTGFCVSMMWPGSLIVASEKFPNGGVLIFALMAAGGDLGASVGPQLVGIVTDFSIKYKPIIQLSDSLQISPDQLGLKLGLLVGMISPLLAIPIYHSFKKRNKS